MGFEHGSLQLISEKGPGRDILEGRLSLLMGPLFLVSPSVSGTLQQSQQRSEVETTAPKVAFF